jgi:hypothetical protein
MKHRSFQLRGMLLLAATLLTSCGLGGRPTNIQPGEADYPVENPHPDQVVNFTAIIPTSLHVVFIVGYTADAGGEGLDGPSRMFSVTPPLELTREGDVYRGKIAFDRYLPGNCHWGFSGVWYKLEDPYASKQELVFQDGNAHPADNRIDAWCVDGPGAAPLWPWGKPEHRKYCQDIKSVQSLIPASSISPQGIEEIVANGGGNGPPIRVNIKNVRKILVQIHDLNSADGDRTLKTD